MKARKSSAGRKCCALLLCALLLLCSGCSRSRTPVLIGRGDPYDRYPAAAAGVLPEYESAMPKKALFYELGTKGAAECFDVQAVPAIRQGVGNYWYPHALATVVIAADRGRTDFHAAGWKDLQRAGVPVAWNGDAAARTLMLGALAYGLEGENFTREVTAEYIRNAGEAFLPEPDWNAPVMVCFDYQAAELIRKGRNLEIIVPCEGTLSYALGLLSRQMLPVFPDEILLENGFRLLDGRCTERAYPQGEAYAPACRASALPEKTLERLPVLFEESELMLQGKTGFAALIPPDGQLYTALLLLMMILTIAWMSSAVHRAIRPELQKAVRWMALLMLCWLMIRLLRCQFPTDSAVETACRYAGFFLQPALPMVLLYMISILDRPEAGGRPPRWMILPAGGFAVSEAAALVLIRFSPQGRKTGPAAVCIYGLFLFVLAAVLILRKAEASPKRVRWIVPAACSLLFAGYTVSWAAGVRAAHAVDYTLAFCFLWLLLMESILSTGILPANTRYDLLFSSSPMNMQLLDECGRTVLAGRQADVLSPVLRVQLCTKNSTCIPRDENTLLYSRAIRHGTVIWQEDISALNALHRRIGESVQRLTAANVLLRREGEVQRRTLAADVRIRLFDALEAEIREKTDELGEMIRTLEQSGDKEHRIAYITLLLCHIKRRCNLFFLVRESSTLPCDELSMYLDELSEFAGYAGVRALVRSGISGEMDIRRATLCYDFYFSVLAWSIRQSGSTLLGCLEEHGGVEFSILAQANAGEPEFPESFCTAVQQAGGRLSFRTIDDRAGIYLNFEKGEAAGG